MHSLVILNVWLTVDFSAYFTWNFRRRAFPIFLPLYLSSRFVQFSASFHIFIIIIFFFRISTAMVSFRIKFFFVIVHHLIFIGWNNCVGSLSTLKATKIINKWLIVKLEIYYRIQLCCRYLSFHYPSLHSNRTEKYYKGCLYHSIPMITSRY